MSCSKINGKFVEIEEIIKHKRTNDNIFFRVKLKGHESQWLPLIDMKVPCHNMILAYFKNNNISILDLPPFTAERRAKHIFDLLGSVSESDLEEFAKRFDNMSFPPTQYESLMRELKLLPHDDDSWMFVNDYVDSLRERVLTEKCIQIRERQVRQLQESEWLINMVSNNKHPLRLQNNRDFRVFPNFTYVNKYILSHGINIPVVSPCNGCGREPTNKKHKCSKLCVCMKNKKPAYDKNGLIIHEIGAKGVRECNEKCKCDETCTQRVVQKGCKVKLLIFRTATKTGWGVKTLEFLPKGTFIGTYPGKVILWEEGESLPDVEGRSSYLFDIDYRKIYDDHCKYTVDAYEYGNFTRFINHSCDPNLTVYNVWIDSFDEDLHDIAFFTKKNIAVGEELTFNYRKMLKECKCGASKCVPVKNGVR